MNILITGGASGLGLEITKNLAQDVKNTVFFTYCNSLEASKNLEKEFANVRSIRCDFKDPNSVNELQEKIKGLELQVLINNAISSNEIKHFHKIARAGTLDSFTSNVLPVVLITQAAVDVFRKNKFGKVITILSSSIINKPPIGWSVYTAEKNYLLSICKSIAAENANFNITSNIVSPAFMQTELNESIDERIVEEMANKHPLKSLLTTKEGSESVNYLVHCSQQINGLNLVINAAENI